MSWKLQVTMMFTLVFAYLNGKQFNFCGSNWTIMEYVWIAIFHILFIDDTGKNGVHNVIVNSYLHN